MNRILVLITLSDNGIETIKSTGVENLIVVLGGPHYEQIVSHLGDGSHLGLNITYKIQDRASGIAHGVNLCKNSINSDKFILMLGDNLYENGIEFPNTDKASIVLSSHHNLNRFGVASISDNKIVKIEEKPIKLQENCDNYAITGCYLFNSMFFEYFKDLKPSARGEYEISHIIEKYNNDNNLNYTFASGLWSDAGTHESVHFLSNFFYYKDKKTAL